MIFAKNFARNYEKKYLEHQMLGRWVVRPSDPEYHIEDCRILEILVHINFYPKVLPPTGYKKIKHAHVW